MSKYVIYLSLPKYKRDWLNFCFGDPVVFPPSSPQNSIIRAFITPLPKGKTPDLPVPGSVAISIPDSKAKPVDRYNYMGRRGKEAVREAVDDLFRRALWNGVNPLENEDVPVGLNKLIAAWCENNGIDYDHIETVRQCYARMRKHLQKCSVNLQKTSGKI